MGSRWQGCLCPSQGTGRGDGPVSGRARQRTDNPGNRLRAAHSYSLCVKRAVVKFAFPSFSCHWPGKYELWADAPGWEPGAGLGLQVPSPAAPPGLCPPPAPPAGIWAPTCFLLSSVSIPRPLPRPPRASSSPLSPSFSKLCLTAAGARTQHNAWHQVVCKTNNSL